MNRIAIVIITTLLAIAIILPSVNAQETNKPIFTKFYPEDNQRIGSTNPTIRVEYTDDSGIDQSTGVIRVDNLDVTEYEVTSITEKYIEYKTPTILKLREGNHTVYVEITDTHGNKNSTQWTFIIDTNIKEGAGPPLDIFQIIIYVIIGCIIGLIVFGLYILYLKKTKKFTWKKYFVQHHIPKKYFLIYIPLIIAAVFILLGFLYASSNEDLSVYSYEYVFVIGLLIAIVPYAIESRLEKRRIERYERGFAQFLFEMADAMRGGLDPTKAVIELASTNTGILKDHLRLAANALKIGRPFDEIIQVMVRPFKSDLINRYASLIAETSKIGGETAHVIHRAAKDMDDFIKVSAERRRQLTSQIVVIYIAFAVLLIIIYQLLTIFPSLEGFNMNLLGGADLEAASKSAATTRMDPILLKRRFFHMVLINSIGAGCIIGGLTEGKIKFGLLHIFVLVITTTVFFALLIL